MANEFYSFQGPSKRGAPSPVIAQRDPTTSDTGYEIGQTWVNTADDETWTLTSVSGTANWEATGSGSLAVATLTGDSGGAISPTAGNINILGGDTVQVSGAGSTLTVNASEGGYPITPYVVGSATEAGYTTIQDALDAADAAGGGVVYIQPGTYTEDLTLYDAVSLYGTPAVSQNQGATVTIIGTHTPPTSGNVGFNSLCFISTTDAFLSAAAGTTHLSFLNCESNVQGGYFLNLDNWTGTLELYDNNPDTAGATGATDDGGINNSGGATVILFSAGVGSSASTPFNVSGVMVGESSEIGAPLACATGTDLDLQWVGLDQPVTLSGNTTGFIRYSSFTGGAAAAITMSSTGAVEVSNCVIDSSNSPAVDGAGAGVLSVGDNTFLSNALYAATLTLAELDTVVSPVMNNTVNLRGRDAAGTADVEIAQVNASDQVQIGSGGANVLVGATGTTPGAGVVQSITRTDAQQTTSRPGLQIDAFSTGTPAASFGSSIDFRAENDTNVLESQGRMQCLWTNAGTGTEASAFLMLTRTGGGAYVESTRFVNTGLSTNAGTTVVDFVSATTSPTVSGAGAAGAGTYTFQVGSYMTTGAAGAPEAFCIFNFNIAWSAHTGTGNLLLNLPVAAANVANQTPPCALLVDGLAVTAGSQPYAETIIASTTAAVVEVGAGTKAAVAMDTAVAQFCGTLIYKI